MIITGGLAACSSTSDEGSQLNNKNGKGEGGSITSIEQINVFDGSIPAEQRAIAGYLNNLMSEL